MKNCKVQAKAGDNWCIYTKSKGPTTQAKAKKRNIISGWPQIYSISREGHFAEIQIYLQPKMYNSIKVRNSIAKLWKDYNF